MYASSVRSIPSHWREQVVLVHQSPDSVLIRSDALPHVSGDLWG